MSNYAFNLSGHRCCLIYPGEKPIHWYNEIWVKLFIKRLKKGCKKSLDNSSLKCGDKGVFCKECKKRNLEINRLAGPDLVQPHQNMKKNLK
jgi:hypothetical protein